MGRREVEVLEAVEGKETGVTMACMREVYIFKSKKS